MPYISPEKRSDMNKVVEAMKVVGVKADGDLNYILFKYCKETVPSSYNSIKNFLGELDECRAEIRRRLLAPYEDMKIEQNGDVSHETS